MKHINRLILLFFLLLPRLSHAEWTPLHQAAAEGNLEQAQNLLNGGADVNATDEDGDTPLHQAAWNGHEAIAKLLFDRGVDVNAVNKASWTPLHCATYKGDEAIVKLLLNRGANVTAGNALTPLYIAELLYKHAGIKPEVVILLKCWPDFKKRLKERKEQMHTFLMATHNRLGAESPVKILPKDLFYYIWQFVKPTIAEINQEILKQEQAQQEFVQHQPAQQEPQLNRSWLNTVLFQGGAAATAIAGLGVLVYQLFKRR